MGGGLKRNGLYEIRTSKLKHKLLIKNKQVRTQELPVVSLGIVRFSCELVSTENGKVLVISRNILFLNSESSRFPCRIFFHNPKAI